MARPALACSLKKASRSLSEVDTAGASSDLWKSLAACLTLPASIAASAEKYRLRGLSDEMPWALRNRTRALSALLIGHGSAR